MPSPRATGSAARSIAVAWPRRRAEGPRRSRCGRPPRAAPGSGGAGSPGGRERRRPRPTTAWSTARSRRAGVSPPGPGRAASPHRLRNPPAPRSRCARARGSRCRSASVVGRAAAPFRAELGHRGDERPVDAGDGWAQLRHGLPPGRDLSGSVSSQSAARFCRSCRVRAAPKCAVHAASTSRTAGALISTSSRPFGRDRDELGPCVARVGDPANVARPLELIHDGPERLLTDLRGVGELGRAASRPGRCAETPAPGWSGTSCPWALSAASTADSIDRYGMNNNSPRLRSDSSRHVAMIAEVRGSY